MFFRDSLIVNKIELLKTDLEEKKKFLIDIYLRLRLEYIVNNAS